MSDGHYDVGQICENGHVISGMAGTHPGHNQDFCETCGARTLVTCPCCSTTIRGQLPGMISFGRSYTAPAFCFKCGKPFPWTLAGLRAAEELADEMDVLTDQEKETLKASVHDLVRETPKSQVAKTRFKKIMRKVGREGSEAMRSVLTTLVSESVRSAMFGA